MRTRVDLRAARGFTLVEAIVSIVIIGILGAIVAVFIKAPIQGYADSVARAEAGDEADLALRRMAREIRLALPNSVRVNADGSAIEFLLTKTGGRYLAAEDEVDPANGTPLSFTDPDSLAFTVVGGLQADVAAGDYVVVYNLGPGLVPADAYAFNQAGVDRNIARLESASAGSAKLVMKTRNPFARDDPMPSPGSRFQIVSTPVTFQCAPEGSKFVLRRYAGYAIRNTMSDPMSNPAPGSAVLARRVSGCANLFRYDAADLELQRSALVLITLVLTTRGAGDAGSGLVRLVHQVHVDNTP